MRRVPVPAATGRSVNPVREQRFPLPPQYVFGAAVAGIALAGGRLTALPSWHPSLVAGAAAVLVLAVLTGASTAASP